MGGIEPFHVMELMTKAQALEARGRDIVDMEVGETDFPTPQPIIEAARRFIAGGHVHYIHALGLWQLRETIARFYQSRYGVDVAPERIEDGLLRMERWFRRQKQAGKVSGYGK